MLPSWETVFTTSHSLLGQQRCTNEVSSHCSLNTYEDTPMARLFHPLLVAIASSTDRQLAKYIEYLKAENQILRARLPKHIHTTPAERKILLKYGKAVGAAIKELITIVTPRTFYRWLAEENSGRKKPVHPKGGRRKPAELRKQIINIAETTGFGYTRILGELYKLGIKSVSRQTIRNILKEEGINPKPARHGDDSWAEFLNRHGKTLWAIDFFSMNTITRKGIKQLYVLIFICQQTREVIASPSTEHPNSARVKEQAEFFLEETADREDQPKLMIRDRDTKFSKEFNQALKDGGVTPIPLPPKSPNLNGRCERVIGTIKYECLLRFIIFGKRHLDYLVAEFVDYYNHTRSHMERGHLPPLLDEEPEEIATIKLSEIEVKEYVGGLVKSFEQKAA